MSEVEKAVRHFIERMKFDVKTTKEYMGDDERFMAVASAQDSFIEELEETVDEAVQYD